VSNADSSYKTDELDPNAKHIIDRGARAGVTGAEDRRQKTEPVNRGQKIVKAREYFQEQIAAQRL
jgi:hypothetical protein